MRELEATIWCPVCRVEKFAVWRVRVTDHVFVHETVPENSTEKVCECGTTLERK